jgi:uncharacterized cupin superfamily protein
MPVGIATFYLFSRVHDMAMHYFEQAVQAKLPDMRHLDGEESLDHLAAQQAPDENCVSGFLRMKKSQKPLEYHYRYHEMNIIAYGELWISDETGREIHARVGDLLYFEKGSTIIFQSPSEGIGFFCGQGLEG